MQIKRISAVVVLVTLAVIGVGVGIFGFFHSHHSAAPSATTNLHPLAQSGATLSLITEPAAGIAPILSLIRKASSSIDLTMYELQDTQVEAALAAAAARGVVVRVLLNEDYNGATASNGGTTSNGANINTAAYDYLHSNGVAVRWTPSYFALTHEKSLVVDRAAAAILSFNFTPKYYASDRDFGIIDRDPGDVGEIENVFDADWAEKNAAPSASGANATDLVWSPGSENTIIAMIAGAQKSLAIYNEEIEDDDVVDALAAAAKRGVAVDIVMTYSSEWKSAFQKLATAGVHIRTYATSAPLYIHAKMIIADGSAAFIGSENFSYTSLAENRELGILFADPAIIASLFATFAADWRNATPY